MDYPQEYIETMPASLRQKAGRFYRDDSARATMASSDRVVLQRENGTLPELDVTGWGF